MTYCKDYCEEKGISTSELNEAQRTLYYIAENMRKSKSISEEGYEHFQQAIKSLEQEPCEDAIGRKALKNAIRDGVRDKKNESLFDTIDNMPSVIPTRKKGKWIELRDSYDEPYEVCSICNCNGTHIFDYCPFCGVEMEKVRISNE